jgi:Cu/Ag efflux pump CusA
MTQATHELRQIPGIRNVATHIGRAVTGDQVVGIESAQHWVSIDRNADYRATLAAIREAVQAYPGFDSAVQTYLSDLAKGVVTQAGDPIVVRVQGPEREVLRYEAEKMAQMLSQIPGLVNVRLDGQAEAPQIEIEVNLLAAGRVGLKPGDVRRAAATVFAGLEVGNLYEQQKVFDVVVWGAPEVRRSLTNVENLLIDTPIEGYVRLGDVADVRVVATPTAIEREGVSRRIDIRADVEGRNASSILREVKERLQKHNFPLEYHAVLLEARREQQAAYWQVAALAAVIGIYLLLQACFQSWRLASLLSLSAVAVALSGALAAFATSGTLLLGSLAGVLAVVGLAVRNGISLIDRYQHLEHEEGEALGPRLVMLGARERLGPILTSAAAVGAALLPVAAFGETAGLEILHPMAMVILAGLLVSAIINLFVIPALYLRFASPQPGPALPAANGGERYA